MIELSRQLFYHQCKQKHEIIINNIGDVRMRANNLKAWKYNQNLNCLLFFAQRMDELLFHHTIDTYRYSALSIRNIAVEFCNVYLDVKSGKLNEKNLSHILSEFTFRLAKDDISRYILSDYYVTHFLKHHLSWDTKRQFENIKYIIRKLGNRVYYERVVEVLKSLIAENKQKKEIDKKTAIFVRELIDCGYNENYIFKVLHEVFFSSEVSSLDSLERFFNRFDFKKKKYDVYIGFSTDISSLFPLFQKLEISDLKVTMIEVKSAPLGIKTKRQRTMLKFDAVDSLDMYSAFYRTEKISSCIVDSYSFFRHDPSSIRTYGQVICEDNRIETIRPKNLLKYRVAALSREESKKNAESLFKILFANYHNFICFSKITRVHNAAVYSENTSDSLLSLWSILESIVDDDVETINMSEDYQGKRERSKIRNVVLHVLPFLKSTYIEKLVRTCMSDIIGWDRIFFDTHIADNPDLFGNNNIERTFSFLSFESADHLRNKLYSHTEEYPLLRYRIFSLAEQLKNSKGIKELINNHAQRVEWQLYRIYRARNYIIHDAQENIRMNQELVINLHSYIDILISETMRLINSSPFNDSINEAMAGHKLSTLIMDERVKNQENENICEENALRYLYYNFEK